jgi:hypothetical protein
MANIQITQLPTAGAITGTESVPIVQNGVTVQTTTGAIAASPSQPYTYLTVNQTPQLANSRALSGGTGVGLVDGGAQSTLQITLNGASGSLEAAGNGVIVKTGSSTVTPRTLSTAGNGISVTDGSGVSGNPTFQLTGIAAAIANASGTGMLAIVGGSTIAGRQITGTTDQITVTDGNGAGNPTISLANNPVLPGVASVTIPIGATATRPASPVNGMLRYSTTFALFEGYINNTWQTIAAGSGVTSVATGTGLTGGPITSTGTISIDVTGVTAATYGSASAVPQFTVNAQGQLTSASNVTISIPASAINTTIPNSGLTNNSVTYNGVTVALGASGTITATATNALTIGTGLTGTSYNGSSAVTIAIDSTVATLTGTQTLTNKTISGASNTLTNIANASLTNSQITLGTTNIALGGTALTPAGLTSVTVTQNPVAALDLATKQYVDTLVSSGITFHSPVKYEVPSGNLVATYNNGAAGVGATLTNAGALVAFTPDGTVASVADRILIYNQTNQAQNGVYVVTTVGDGSTAWVLTRASDADTYALKSPNGLGEGDAFFITSGATGAGETYVCNTVGVITFGTTAITFVQISATQIYSAGTGLTLTGTQFSISNTAVSAGAYGSATQVGTFTVNAQGQLTLAGNTTVTPAVGSITGLGTGVATALAVNVGSAGAFVTFDGALGTPSSGTVTNLTGTAAININGTVGATTPTTGNFTTVTATTGIFGGIF